MCSSMPNLGDDEVTSILNFVSDSKDRKSASQVSKQWLRVEGRTRLSIRVRDLDLLHNFLPRFTNLLHFEFSSIISNAHLEFIAKTCPFLQTLNLNLRNTHERLCDHDFGDVGIEYFAKGCQNLCKVLLRKRKNFGNDGIVALVKNVRGLSWLDLGGCGLVGDESLEAIAELGLIRVLNLERRSLVSDKGLVALAEGNSSKSLKRLNLTECDRLTDHGVSFLKRMCFLEDLNLADCGPKVTDTGALSIASISSLKRLNLSWLINISNVTIAAIAENCRNLVTLELTGCEMITGFGIASFANHKCLESLMLDRCQNFFGYEVTMFLTFKSLKVLVLDRGLRMWVPGGVEENLGRFCEINWR